MFKTKSALSIAILMSLCSSHVAFGQEFDDSVGDTGPFMSPDACPNLFGYQGSVPDGYQKVGGDCIALPPPVPASALIPVTTSVFTDTQFRQGGAYRLFGGGRFFSGVTSGYEISIINETGEAIDVVAAANCMSLGSSDSPLYGLGPSSSTLPRYSSLIGHESFSAAMGHLFVGSYQAGRKFEINHSAVMSRYRAGRGFATIRTGCTYVPVNFRVLPGQDISASYDNQGHLLSGGEFFASTGRQVSYHGAPVSQEDQTHMNFNGAFSKQRVSGLPSSSQFSGVQTVAFRLSNGQRILWSGNRIFVD